MNNNPIINTDSSGHCIDGLTTVPCLLALIAIAGGAGAAANYEWNVIGHSWWESPEYAAGTAQATAEGAFAAEGAALLVGSVAAAAPVIATGLCADGDCGNEVSAAAAQTNGSVVGQAAQRINQYWTSTTNFEGNLVYQRPDLIDPNLTNNGLTNLQRMQQGLAPIGPDGYPMQLYHMLQTMNGPIAEITRTFHQTYSSIIHIYPNTLGSGIDRVAFKTWRVHYWMYRATDFIIQ